MTTGSDLDDIFRCPKCKSALTRDDQSNLYVCQNPECDGRYPVVDGIPIFIDDTRSVFAIEDFTSKRSTFYNARKHSKFKVFVRRLIPKIGMNISADETIPRFCEMLTQNFENPRVLVVGGSTLGKGMETFKRFPSIKLVETDVTFGPYASIICDAHQLPFADGSFDGVVAQAVLEHVVDPAQCSEEFYRILNDRGLIFAETPFMQQVHCGRYDFTRFTHLGHRRLFRKFEEIESGIACGPGMALAWSWQYFLWSFTTNRPLRTILRIFACFTSFFLKYFDRFLARKPGALDAASGLYFIGRKSDKVLSDRDLVKLYAGSIY